MKKIICLLILGLIIQQNLWSQNLGVQAGFYSSTLSMDSPNFRIFNHNSKSADLFIGVTSEFKIIKNITVVPAIIFSKREASYSASHNEIFGYVGPVYYSINSSFELKWLDIPIPIKVYFPIKDSKIFIMAGPYFSYGLGGINRVTEYDFGNTTYSGQNIWFSDKNKNVLKRYDYGITFGVGFEFFKFFNFTFTFNKGLADISTPLTESSKVETISSGLSFGFKVPITKKDDSK